MQYAGKIEPICGERPALIPPDGYERNNPEDHAFILPQSNRTTLFRGVAKGSKTETPDGMSGVSDVVLKELQLALYLDLDILELLIDSLVHLGIILIFFTLHQVERSTEGEVHSFLQTEFG